MEKPSINSEDILDVVQEYCHQEGIQMPEGLKGDFMEHFGEMKPIFRIKALRSNLCGRINNLFTNNPELAERYSDFREDIMNEVRFRLVQKLDLEAIVTRQLECGHSNREFLTAFLESLPEGEFWQFSDIDNFNLNGDTGIKFRDRLINRIGGTKSVVISFILGDRAEELLTRNPFGQKAAEPIIKGAKPNTINNEDILDVVQEYCHQEGIQMPEGLEGDFMEHFGEMKPIRVVRSLNLNLCTAIKQIFRNNQELCDRYANFVTEISDGVRPRLLKMLDLEGVLTRDLECGHSNREFLIAFIESLPEGQSWRPKDILSFEWNGDSGKKFSSRFLRDIGATNETIPLILGDRAKELLTRNPFDFKPRKPRVMVFVDNNEIASDYLGQFLSELKDGEVWSPIILKRWKGKNGVGGSVVYRWIKDNLGNGRFTEESVKACLGADADKYLKRNPFEKHRSLSLVEDIKTGLKDFLDDLEDGESWSPKKLFRWVGNGNLQGASLYDRIMYHYTLLDQHGVDWLYILVKLIPEEYLSKNPFRYWKRDYIGGKDDFTTGNIDFSEMNFGRGVADPLSKNPEQLLIDEEYRIQLAIDIADLYKKIEVLPVNQRDLAMRFLSEGDVDGEDMLNLVVALKGDYSSEESVGQM